MAISLSELTGASTSGNVLNEVNSYADFLDSVPRLVNKADPSGDTDAVQTTATNQPKALPLDANGKGYCYLPVTTGNAPAVTFPAILANEDFVFEMKVYLVSTTLFHLASDVNGGQRIYIGNISFGLGPRSAPLNSPLASGVSTLTVERSGDSATLKQDGIVKATISSGVAATEHYLTHLSFNGQYATSILPLNGYIQTCTLSIEGTEELNIDFTSPRIPHGSREFKCETGQVVTVNTSGSDPATIIKKPVLRFDGVNTGLLGLFNQTITEGYMFAAFSVLGDGGAAYGRIFSTNKTTLGDTDSSGFIWALRNNLANDLHYYTQGGFRGPHADFFDADRGDYIYELKNTSGSQKSNVNDADLKTSSVSTSLELQEFNIGAQQGARHTAIDLEYLALFPASLSDSQADQIRNFINNRNRVFSLIDSQGYFFFDGAATYDGQVFSGSGSWNGRIVGSDNGDSDFYANENTTSENRPTTDGYKVTFADNSDKLDIPQVTLAAGDSYAWMVCGTSLGTFSYKVTVSGETELNLLGHLGNATFRKAGDLYGIILLPESATNRDIEEARKLLVDRGAADGVSVTNLGTFWYDRSDIVEFSHINTSSVTTFAYSWLNCSSLQEFPLLDSANVTDMQQAWLNNVSLQSFPALQAPLCTNFTSAWNGCSALTSFPADAKLGTEATGSVNFTSAWQNSGLTSFSTPLPTATTLSQAWYGCGSLTSFSSEFPLVTYAGYGWINCASLTSFSTPLPLSNRFVSAWKNCTSLTDFSADVFANWNPSSISSGVFNNAWEGCTSLTAQSVENILTSIDTSGKYATSTGLSGGTALGDAGIDIDYNGDPLSAATTAAITSLKSKGWSIFINSVEQ